MMCCPGHLTCGHQRSKIKPQGIITAACIRIFDEFKTAGGYHAPGGFSLRELVNPESAASEYKVNGGIE